MERRSVIEQHVCTRSPKHHRALAGGTSTSPIQNNHPYLLLEHHRALAGGSSISELHEQVAAFWRPSASGFKFSQPGSRDSSEIEEPPAKAWWCPGPNL